MKLCMNCRRRNATKTVKSSIGKAKHLCDQCATRKQGFTIGKREVNGNVE